MEVENENTRAVEFEFRGKASEYFSIWIVNVCLSIITLGIYSAWAKVRNNQYFYGNTLVDGSPFQYLADPLKILKGRIIAFIAFAAYYFSGLVSPVAALVTFGILMLLTPAFMVMSMSFRMRNSAWRNVRFDFNKDFRKAYLILAMPVVLVGMYLAISLGMQTDIAAGDGSMEELPKGFIVLMIAPIAIMLFFPWWEYLINRFQLVNSSFGRTRFAFKATPNDYYIIYIAAIVVLVAGGIALALVAGGITAASMAMAEDGESSLMVPLILGVVWLGFLPLYLWAGAFIQTRKTNLVMNNLIVGEHRFNSDLKVGYMLYLYITNTLAIAFTLGLMMPWAKIRTARYKAEQTQLLPAGDLDGFVAGEKQSQSALGEEVGELFDMDLGM